jgi:hypothetical protein
MKFQDRSDYYLYLAKNDILDRIKPMLEKQGYYLRDEDGKITAELHQTWNTPWHHTNDDGKSDCYLWHSILFDVCGFIPTGCLSCFKVVVRPKTLKQLFALLDLQQTMDRPCKCGIEVRQTVRGNYGGYFYNRSLESGLACYKDVKKAISEDSILAPLAEKVILKRGCTEFEMSCGRSDQWNITQDNFEVERRLSDLIVRKTSLVQPEWVLNHIHANWIKLAWSVDDPTVEEFTGGVPLYQPVMQYQTCELKEE